MDLPTELVPVHLPNGATVHVEVSAAGSPEQQVAGVLPDLSLDKVGRVIEGVAETIFSAFEVIQPRKASIEFGIELGVEPGGLAVLLVKGTGKANLKVTLEWSREQGVD